MYGIIRNMNWLFILQKEDCFMKDKRFEFRLPERDKLDFIIWCEEEGTTPSDQLRRYVKSVANNYRKENRKLEKLRSVFSGQDK